MTKSARTLELDVSGSQVLVADDDDAIRVVVASVLRRLGCGVCAFASAQALLDGLAERAGMPQLIVSDLNMPGMTGLELLERLGNAHCRVPVVIVSGTLDEATVRRAYELGAAGVLAKPFQLDALCRTVCAVLWERELAVG